MEKAHPEVFHILLQVLDDGRITDSQGRRVDFKNTVIIMTSNIGSAALLEREQNEDHIDERTKERVLAQLRASFRPEFLNRIDDIILFKPLSMENIKGIVDKLAGELEGRLKHQHIQLEITGEAKEFIAREAFDPIYGARPLKRYLQGHVETEIAKEIIAGHVHPFDSIVVDVKEGKLAVAAKKT
jgi:ATP-dependent Clp protease ATP-binding subunit ClpB